MQKCFKTEKRIRLGLWGLGRGADCVEIAKAVNIDIVADFTEPIERKQ